jgi:hypothetical protein
MVSLVVGLPGETVADVERSIEWVESLAGVRTAVFPVFHVPVDAGSGVRSFGVSDMAPEHWRLYESSYRLNFRSIPDLYRESHAEAGTPLWRRALLRVLGRGNIVVWRARLRRGAGGRTS